MLDTSVNGGDDSSSDESTNEEQSKGDQPKFRTLNVNYTTSGVALARKKLPTEEEVETTENNESSIQAMLADVEEDLKETVLLNCCQITEPILSKVTTFVWLSELVCHKNKLSAIPSAFFSLENLLTLRITENLIESIPPEIVKLSSLTTLDVNHNSLKDLPLEFNQLANLSVIILDFNQFNEIPVKSLKLPQLQELHIAENPGITGFPPQDSLGCYKKCAIHINNRPNLVDEAKSIVANVGGVTIEWNKVYPDRVLDFLYLGSLRTAQDLHVYRDLDIKYVLTCGGELRAVISEGMQHKILNILDTDAETLHHVLTDSIEFVESAQKSGHRILVHCFAGLSRSPSIVCAYLMKALKLSFDDAMALIRKARPAVSPNPGFCCQLREFEKFLQTSK